MNAYTKVTPLPPNPKKAYGDKKPDFAQLPLSAMIHWALAHMDGGYKYGFHNWRESKVEARTYTAAMVRHIKLYEAGEDYARDTRVHNLGGVMACCAILIDAEVNGVLIDNRSKSPAACDLLHAAEAMVSYLKEAQAERDAAKLKEHPAFVVDIPSNSSRPANVQSCERKSCPTPGMCSDVGRCLK